MKLPFPVRLKACKAMVFVDGENLAIRYRAALGDGQPADHVRWEQNLFVWSKALNLAGHACDIVGRYYYTSAQGDEQERARIHDELQSLGVERPRVFRKDKQRGSKRVDISLAVDMLGHASRSNYDVAILVAGDEDYVPLVDAVTSEGRRVFLWFLQNGLSPALRRRADHFFDVGEVLFRTSQQLTYWCPP